MLDRMMTGGDTFLALAFIIPCHVPILPPDMRKQCPNRSILLRFLLWIHLLFLDGVHSKCPFARKSGEGNAI